MLLMRALSWKYLMLVDGKMAMLEVTTLKLAIETMGTKIVWALNKCLQEKMVNSRHKIKH
jgi:hypothetical protein